MPVKETGSFHRFLESDFAVPLLAGGGIGTAFYVLKVFFLEEPFKIYAYLGFISVVIAGSFFVKYQFSHVGEGISNMLFGMGRKSDPKDYEREIWKDHIAKAERAENYLDQARLWKGYLQSGLMDSPVSAALKLAQIYEEKLIRPQDALYWYRKVMSLSQEAGIHRAEAVAAVERLRIAMQASDLDFQQRESRISEAMEGNDLEKAMELARELQHHYPKIATPIFYLGVIASRLNNHALAAAHYSDVLEREPNHERAAFNLAVAFQKAERDLEARDAWQKYLDRFGQVETVHTETAKSALAELSAQLRSELSAVEQTPE